MKGTVLAFTCGVCIGSLLRLTQKPARHVGETLPCAADIDERTHNSHELASSLGVTLHVPSSWQLLNAAAVYPRGHALFTPTQDACKCFLLLVIETFPCTDTRQDATRPYRHRVNLDRERIATLQLTICCEGCPCGSDAFTLAQLSLRSTVKQPTVGCILSGAELKFDMPAKFRKAEALNMWRIDNEPKDFELTISSAKSVTDPPALRHTKSGRRQGPFTVTEVADDAQHRWGVCVALCPRLLSPTTTVRILCTVARSFHATRQGDNLFRLKHLRLFPDSYSTKCVYVHSPNRKLSFPLNVPRMATLTLPGWGNCVAGVEWGDNQPRRIYITYDEEARSQQDAVDYLELLLRQHGARVIDRRQGELSVLSEGTLFFASAHLMPSSKQIPCVLIAIGCVSRLLAPAADKEMVTLAREFANRVRDILRPESSTT
jgi:hypothetical protein